jgi:uncharacterized protein
LTAAPSRVAALDLLRGVAVLGILAINIGGFAGPQAATLSPDLPAPGSFADHVWFAFAMLVFEGKMRALFSLLFGASLLLFIERAEAGGANGELLQIRRLGWLALFGYLHWLVWWGDILFTYALVGFTALAFRQAPTRVLVAGGLAFFVMWHGLMTLQGVPQVTLEQHVLAGRVSAGVAADYRAERAIAAQATADEMAGYRRGLVAQAAAKLADEPGEPVAAALNTMGEILPLMLLGMALFRSGFFAGAWPRRTLARLALAGTLAGGVMTAVFVGWAWAHRWPPDAMVAALAFWLAVPHLLMALGYAAALVCWTPQLAATALGQRLIAAGRMAFSNYLGMTLVMTAIFYGWGLGLVGQVPLRWQGLFVLGGWVLMLGWSVPWLARFRQGPLEWVWRSLTLGRRLPLRRAQ